MGGQQLLKVSLLIVFCLVLCSAAFGLFWRPNNISAFVTVIICLTGAIILLALSDVIETFRIGPGGIVAQLHKTIEQQQEIINFFVKYSLAEIIYRELLWKIAHNVEVKADRSPDQVRWLTFLFDHGMLQSKRDTTTWLDFNQIEVGTNLSEVFKATPAAERLVELRGQPSA
jgi:hypothetical protein